MSHLPPFDHAHVEAAPETAPVPIFCPVCKLPVPSSVALVPGCREACDDGIDRTPGICGGRWRIAGTRIFVQSLHSMGAHGLGITRIHEVYPHLPIESLQRVFRWLTAGGAREVALEHMRVLLEDADIEDALSQAAEAARCAGLDAEAFADHVKGLALRIFQESLQR